MEVFFSLSRGNVNLESRLLSCLVFFPGKNKMVAIQEEITEISYALWKLWYFLVPQS